MRGVEGRAELLEVVRARGYLRLDEPVRLASGEWSRDFVDVKAALADGAALRLACEELLAVAEGLGAAFDALGGMTMGADCFAHGAAVLGGLRWFVVRTAPKGRGTDRLVEGAALAPGVRVLLVDDVATTGGSILRAHDAVLATGAEVVGAVTLLDRGERTAKAFADLGVPYAAVLNYRDLGIEPVGGG